MIATPQSASGSSPAASGSSQGTAVTVSVQRQPDLFMGLARATFAAFGLRDDASIARFNRFIGTDELQRWADHFRNHRGTLDDMKAAGNQPVWNTSVYVYPWFLGKLREFGIDFTIGTGGNVRVAGIAPNAGKPVGQMSDSEKVAEAIRRAIPLLPAEIREEVKALLTPEALAVAVGVLVVWAASHFIGVGEIVDVVLLAVGAVTLGAVAFKAGEELIGFAMKSVNATKSEDLDRAAQHFADAVALIGIQAVMTLLFKGRPRAFTKPYKKAATVTPKTIARSAPPRTRGRFYKPKTTADPTMRAGEGGTSIFGDIVYSSRGSTDTRSLVRIHEKVHQFLTPKLYLFRNVRLAVRMNGYMKSFILRYLEEALAETIAQVGVFGWRSAINGITFPVKNGYLTIRDPLTLNARQIRRESLTNLTNEAVGIFLGPINLGGMIYYVHRTYTAPSFKGMEEVKPK